MNLSHQHWLQLFLKANFLERALDRVSLYLKLLPVHHVEFMGMIFMGSPVHVNIDVCIQFIEAYQST